MYSESSLSDSGFVLGTLRSLRRTGRQRPLPGKAEANGRQAPRCRHGARQFRVIHQIVIGGAFPQATGAADYDGEYHELSAVGVEARYVLLTNVTNWGDASYTGLSEVRFWAL